MIHKCTDNDDPILNNQFSQLVKLTRELSQVSYKNNVSAGFVWDSWEEELKSKDEVIRSLFIDSLEDGDTTLYLAIVDGFLSGFLMTKQFEEVMVIRMLCIDKDYRKKGLGMELMGTVISDSKDLKCATISVGTEFNNHEAISLYKKCGLVPFSVDLGMNL